MQIQQHFRHLRSLGLNYVLKIKSLWAAPNRIGSSSNHDGESTATSQLLHLYVTNRANWHACDTVLKWANALFKLRLRYLRSLPNLPNVKIQ